MLVREVYSTLTNLIGMSIYLFECITRPFPVGLFNEVLTISFTVWTVQVLF